MYKKNFKKGILGLVSVALLGSYMMPNVNAKGAIIPVENSINLGNAQAPKTILVYPNGKSSLDLKTNKVVAEIKVDEQAGTIKVKANDNISFEFKIKTVISPKEVKNADSYSYDQFTKFLTVKKSGKNFTINIAPMKGLSPAKTGFPIVTKDAITPVYYDASEAQVVDLSVSALQGDITDISEQTPVIIEKKSWEFSEEVPFAVLVATVNKSELGKKLAEKMPQTAQKLNNKWEKFALKIVDNPIAGVKKALVILGSDRRGTAYGVFEVSKRLGVSPLKWWADVAVEKRSEVYLKDIDFVSQEPSVKYRGIFLNDEDWGLQPWAAAMQDTDVKDIGPKTYAKIFELLLRMKANFIWTAMHPCTKAFYYYKNNPKVADDYAIVVGSSHCEPMLRNNVDEWKKNFTAEYGKRPGPWRYDTNSKEIYRYWNDRVQESKNYESVYTVGMRGIHDGSMPGGRNEKEKIALMDKVIEDQRAMLNKISNNQAEKIPQIFCPYKEVLKLYQKGVKLPDDVTLVWADDNHGYIRKLSNTKEQKRTGGSGVYYHISYWGYPADYLWLSTTSPSLISFEMSKAYAYDAKRLWVFNVGDIKPAEMEMQFAMDLSWNVESWKPENAYLYNYDWAATTFGAEFAKDIAQIKHEYYRLAVASRPEHSNKVSFSEQDMAQRLADYDKLATMAEKLEKRIPKKLQDAYYQLILYPVLGCKLMNEKQLYATMAKRLANKNSKDFDQFKEHSTKAFNKIKELTKKYNTEIAGGKWYKMMDWKPRNQQVFKMPSINKSENNISLNVKAAICDKPMVLKNGILVGSSSKQLEKGKGGKAQIVFNSPKKQKMPLYGLVKTNSEKEDSWFFDVNNKQHTTVNEVKTNKKFKWVKLADFNLKAGKNTLNVSQREPNAEIKKLMFGKPSELKRNYKKNNVARLAVNADKFVKKSAELSIIDGIGIGGVGVTLANINADSVKLTANNTKDLPKLVYNVPTGYENGSVELRFVPSHAINEEHQLRIVVEPLKNYFATYNLNHKSKTPVWRDNVLRGYSAIRVKLKNSKTISVAFPDPGLVLSQLVFTK
ncbi:glycosyl hydrolase 115 family protein [Lentisphaerota bacterium WC36G]|nr:glycosyl hydrolase 115 family protein [Lentisphaerae bacterium WC36]